ncbi:MAG: hypothetical protein LBQ51_08390 [Desulfovibrio sp.]|nr:hypothetical protein [Desulfovibrio sp.]
MIRYLEQVFFPAFGPVSVEDIEPSHILDAIRPIEGKGKLNTSHRLTNLASQILGYTAITGRIKYNVALGLKRALTLKIVRFMDVNPLFKVDPLYS